jgi:hypothetical protein
MGEGRLQSQMAEKNKLRNREKICGRANSPTETDRIRVKKGKEKKWDRKGKQKREQDRGNYIQHYFLKEGSFHSKKYADCTTVKFKLIYNDVTVKGHGNMLKIKSYACILLKLVKKLERFFFGWGQHVEKC